MFEAMVPFDLVAPLHGATFAPPVSPSRYPRAVSKFRRPYTPLNGYVAVVP
jgi:hypothetical protein